MAPVPSGQYIYSPMITRLYTPRAWRFSERTAMAVDLRQRRRRQHRRRQTDPGFKTSVSGLGRTDNAINKEDMKVEIASCKKIMSFLTKLNILKSQKLIVIK